MNILVLTLSLAAAQPAAASESIQQNNSWSAWRGCWQAEGAPANERVCITTAEGGVRIATVVDGVVRDESRIIADGVPRPVRTDGCTGTERAHWSNDGQRVFLDSNVSCGASPRRVVRGMFAFIAPDEWISVQTATEGDNVATQVVRFTAIERTARMVSADALFDVDENAVNEALEKVGTAAVEEWLALAGQPYQLSYPGQQAVTSSALEQVGRMSNPEVREIVRVVERPVYVHTTYVTNRHHWHYSPWGHHHYGWRWTHRPIIVVRLPVIYRNNNYRRDYWRYQRYGRNDRYDRDRYDRYDRDDRYQRDDRDKSRGSVSREGYRSGRERAAPDRARTEPRPNPPATTRQTNRPTRASAPPRSNSGSSSRGTVTRTARARGNSSR